MNAVVMFTLCVLGFLSLALATVNQAWEGIHRPTRDWYLERDGSWPELAPGFFGWLVQVRRPPPAAARLGGPGRGWCRARLPRHERRRPHGRPSLSFPHLSPFHPHPGATPAPTPTPPQIVRFVILMAQAVPISLYVTLETVKVAQCKVRRARRSKSRRRRPGRGGQEGPQALLGNQVGRRAGVRKNNGAVAAGLAPPRCPTPAGRQLQQAGCAVPVPRLPSTRPRRRPKPPAPQHARPARPPARPASI
jgi:hypothetical protein